jgi:hypothetical protein
MIWCPGPVGTASGWFGHADMADQSNAGQIGLGSGEE